MVILSRDSCYITWLRCLILVILNWVPPRHYIEHVECTVHQDDDDEGGGENVSEGDDGQG